MKPARREAFFSCPGIDVEHSENCIELLCRPVFPLHGRYTNSATKNELAEKIIYRDLETGLYDVTPGLSIKDFALPEIAGYTPIAMTQTTYYYLSVLNVPVLWFNKITIHSYNSSSKTQNVGCHARIIYIKN